MTAPAPLPTPDVRDTWITLLDRVARPVLQAAASRQLVATLPVEQQPTASRNTVAPLEAVARTLVGLAPFLEGNPTAPPTHPIAHQLNTLALDTLESVFDPASPDHFTFPGHPQNIVDAAFLSNAFLHAPNALWAKLTPTTQDRILAAFKSLRTMAPVFNNWLLFSALTEAFIKTAGHAPDPMRVDYALRQHEQWYVGGGWYKDGPSFHLDYYNSLVIQPMLLDTARVFASGDNFPAQMLPEWTKRAHRYAETLERFIAPDGTYPVTGRSITYRCGVFQHLAYLALKNQLPATLSPAQIRVGLTAAIRRTLEAPNTFDDKGFLRIGLSGHQPLLGETYISTGSLYLATAAFLPLGLPPTDPFWSTPDAPTTWQKAWSPAPGHLPLNPDHD